jgi:uncharacterized phage protein gp47/JayE
MSADRPFLKKDFQGIVSDLLAELSSGAGGRTALTDTAEGSVVRTLVEAFGRELAVAYEQVELVYKSGFLDTAEGIALDNLVALLGIERRKAGYLEGMVVFGRSSPAPEDITLPAGTPIAGREQGKQSPPRFETTVSAILRRGDTAVTIAARSVDRGGDPLPPGLLTVMPRPMWGIESVTNPAAMRRRQSPETDDELRARARSTLDRAGRATLVALREAIGALGYADVQIQEPAIGEVRVLIGDPVDDAQMEAALAEARDVVEEVRPVGVRVSLRFTDWVTVSLHAELILDRARPQTEQDALRASLSADLLRYFGSLKANENIRLSKVKNILTGADPIKNLVTADADLLRFEVDGDTILLAEGEYIIQNNRRARLPPGKLSLELVPPDPIVAITLVTKGAPSATPALLAAWSDTLNESLGSRSLPRPIAFSALQELAGGDLDRAILVHEKNGVVVQIAEGQSEELAPFEVARIRTIERKGT